MPLVLLGPILALAHPAPGPQEAPRDLSRLAFMAGCWNGAFSARDGATGTIEERYTSPSLNVMLGTTRYLLDGRAVQFELTTIRLEEAGIVLLPYPGGTPSEHGFPLTSVSEAEAIFEAPEHDFPKRIIYRRSGDELRARIDGGEGSEQGAEWQMSAVACGG
jgi:hypothetical protein